MSVGVARQRVTGHQRHESHVLEMTFLSSLNHRVHERVGANLMESRSEQGDERVDEYGQTEEDLFGTGHPGVERSGIKAEERKDGQKETVLFVWQERVEEDEDSRGYRWQMR